VTFLKPTRLFFILKSARLFFGRSPAARGSSPHPWDDLTEMAYVDGPKDGREMAIVKINIKNTTNSISINERRGKRL
jgi:hypothetical protein